MQVNMSRCQRTSRFFRGLADSRCGVIMQYKKSERFVCKSVTDVLKQIIIIITCIY